MQDTEEMQIWSLGREELLEEGMATHSVLLPGEFPWTEEMGQVIVNRVAKSWTQLKWLSTHTGLWKPWPSDPSSSPSNLSSPRELGLTVK